MKQLLFLFLSLFSISSFGQWETITGSGNVKKETRTVSTYNAVHLSGSMDVRLSYGTPGSVSVEADDNLLPYIETVVEGGTLVIRSKKKTGIKTKTRMTVYVPVSSLKQIRLSGSGNISGEGNFDNDGETDVDLSGSGNINVGLGSFSGLRVDLSGSGNLKVKGSNKKDLRVRLSGSGNIDCSGITSADVTANISGSGNVRVTANNSIEARISGSGNVYYSGSASKLNLKSSGSGKIIKA